MCPSTYINGLLCISPDAISKIQLFKIEEGDLRISGGFDRAIRGIQCMVCWEDRMILVCHGTKYQNCVQEWSLKGELLI